MDWFRTLLLLALSGSSFGFMVSILCEDEMSALMVNQFCIIIMNFGSGLFINNKTKNVIVRALQWISPFRYGSEAMMRSFLKTKEHVDMVFKQYKFDLGTDTCILACGGFLVLFFILSWLSVLYKSRQLFR